jgi:hypothetical protein
MSTTQELVNVESCRTDPVDGLSWTFLLAESTSNETVEKIRSAWAVVASFGRNDDVELGDWPSLREIERQVPTWLSSTSLAAHGYNFECWGGDLVDREWIWWSCIRRKDNKVEIQLKAFGMPISVWTLKVVIELAGAQILDSDIFVSDDLA